MFYNHSMLPLSGKPLLRKILVSVILLIALLALAFSFKPFVIITDNLSQDEYEDRMERLADAITAGDESAITSLMNELGMTAGEGESPQEVMIGKFFTTENIIKLSAMGIICIAFFILFILIVIDLIRKYFWRTRHWLAVKSKLK